MLLIYDEFCSILSHINSMSERGETKQLNFLDSFKIKATRIFLDGFISDWDVELIERLSENGGRTFGSSALTFTFVNEYRPYVGHKI